MPDITMPNGDVVRFPDDMPEDKIRELIVNKFPQKFSDITRGKTFASRAIGAVPFGQDIASGVAGVVGATSPDLTFKDAYQMAREQFQAESDIGSIKYPKTAIAGTGAGILSSAAAVPLRAVKGATLATTGVKSGLTGLGFGFAEGVKEGDKLSERIGSGIQTGVEAAPFAMATGAGLHAAGDYIAPYAKKAAKPLADRARKIFSLGGQRQEPLVSVRIKGGEKTNYDDFTRLTKDSPIPLSKGDITQEARQQAFEVNALKSPMYGDEVQRIAQQSREAQAQAAEDFLKNTAGKDIDFDNVYKAGGDIKQVLDSAYKKARLKTASKYKVVGDMQKEEPLKIGSDYVKKTVLPSIKDWARNGTSGMGFDLNASDMKEAKRLFDQAKMIDKFEKINSFNFNKLEQWRGRVSGALANAEQKVKTGQGSQREVAFLSGMLQRFDDSFNQLPVEAVKNGDDAILDALASARATRSNQGKLFEKNKIIRDILTKEDITNETLAHALFTSGGNNAKQRAATFDAIYKAAGEKGELVKQAYKEGIYSNILKKSMSPEVDATGKGLISFDKLATNLGDLVENNPTLFNKLHQSADEKKVIKAALDAARRIKSKKAGVDNYSNTAYRVIDMLDQISPTASRMKIPLTDLSAESFLRSAGDAQAKKDIINATSNILNLKREAINSKTFNFVNEFSSKTTPVAASPLYQQTQE